MDLQTRVARLENQVKDLQQIIRTLEAEKEAREDRVRRATHRALLHAEDCTCTACLIYKINREV